MDMWGLLTLIVMGFTACAELGSYTFVHPVIRRLPSQCHLTLEQGLLRTSGRVMPPLMTLSMATTIGYAFSGGLEGGPASWRSGAAAALTVSLLVTIPVNVGINHAAGRWDPASPASEWKGSQDRWERFRGVRCWLLLIGFLLLCEGFAT